MNPKQQQLPLRQWGGPRPGAGRKRRSGPTNVAHRPRRRFRRGTLHVTLRLRAEVWNLRTHRCFRALRQAFEHGCERFGYRLIHFSVQGNHIHLIVEAPDAVEVGRAMKGLEVRIARALNRVMRRRGPVFADRYHSHLLRSPREAANAVRYVLENCRGHGLCSRGASANEVDPYCSACLQPGRPLAAQTHRWIPRVGVALGDDRPRLAG